MTPAPKLADPATFSAPLLRSRQALPTPPSPKNSATIDPMGVAIECRGLRKTYDAKVEALRGLDLQIDEGECFGLLGPNGAGKTTAIEILEGLLEPTSGEVRIFGRSWRTDAQQLRQWLGISLQETRLSDKLTVRETVDLFASFYRQPLSSADVLAALALAEKSDAWVGKLSGGQRQRLAVATALVANPRILFLDEPTTGLDPQSRRQLWEIIGEFRRGGGTVLLTTHYMDEAERLCDRLAIIDYGQTIAEGTPPDLIERLGGQNVVEFSIAPAMNHAVTTASNLGAPSPASKPPAPIMDSSRSPCASLTSPFRRCSKPSRIKGPSCCISPPAKPASKMSSSASPAAI